MFLCLIRWIKEKKIKIITHHILSCVLVKQILDTCLFSLCSLSTKPTGATTIPHGWHLLTTQWTLGEWDYIPDPGTLLTLHELYVGQHKLETPRDIPAPQSGLRGAHFHNKHYPGSARSDLRAAPSVYPLFLCGQYTLLRAVSAVKPQWGLPVTQPLL